MSIQGILNAGRDLDRAARRIADRNSPAPADPAPVPADSVEFSKGGPSLIRDASQDVDYAAELAAVSRAKISFRANLKVLSTTLEIEKEAFDHLL
jgi:hypothetical protein